MLQRPQKFFILLITLTIYFAFAMGVSADSNILFVAPNGHDYQGDGSMEKPYASVVRAGRIATAGTTIYLREGVYTEQQIIRTTAGTESAPITIKPYNNETVIFDGEDNDIDYFDSLFLVAGSANIIVEGFEVRNSTGRGISVYESTNIIIRDTHVHNIFGRAIGGSGDQLTFDSNTIENAVMENANEAMNGQGGWSSALRTAKRADGTASTNIIFRNNIVRNVWGEGINALFADGVLMEGNEVVNSIGTNIYIDHSQNVIVRDNTVYATQSFKSVTNELPSGIMMANEYYSQTPDTQIANITIEDNTIYDVRRGIGYWHAKENPNATNTYRNVIVTNNNIENTTELNIRFMEVTEGYEQPELLVIEDNQMDDDSKVEVGNADALAGNEAPVVASPETEENTEAEETFQVFIPVVIQ